MNAKNTTLYTLDPDHPERMSGEERERLESMTDEEAYANAAADPDNPPIDGRARLQRVPDVGALRQALDMSAEEFATSYSIPLNHVQAWEARRAFPSQAARAYLRVIAAMPAEVRSALEAR